MSKNAARTSIRLGPGCQDTEIAGNMFDEAGTGIVIPRGAAGLRVFENLFMRSSQPDIVCDEPTARIVRLPAH